MLFAIYRQSLREYLRPGKIIPWLVLAIICAILSLFWKQATLSPKLGEIYSSVTLFFTFRIGTLAAAILATQVLNAEVEQKTIVYLLTRPVPRWGLMVGRFLACWTAVSLISVVAVLGTGFGIFGGAAFSHHILFTDCLAVILGDAAYCGVFILFSVLSSRSLIVNLLVAFGWELMVPNLPGTAYTFSIFTYMSNMRKGAPISADLLSVFSNLGTGHSISTAVCVTSLLLIAAISMLVAAVIFSLGEFLPKEQVA